MRTKLPILSVAAFSLLLAPQLMFAAEAAGVPRHFSAYIGGFFGPTYRVEAHEGSVTYTDVPRGRHTQARGRRDPRKTVVTPTAAQWREFRQTLDDLKVWQWQGDYPNNGVMDGAQWSLDIAYSDRELKSRGDNNYPDAAGEPNGKPQQTEAFKRYLAAVEKLLGGRGFGITLQ